MLIWIAHPWRGLRVAHSRGEDRPVLGTFSDPLDRLLHRLRAKAALMKASGDPEDDAGENEGAENRNGGRAHRGPRRSASRSRARAATEAGRQSDNNAVDTEGNTALGTELAEGTDDAVVWAMSGGLGAEQAPTLGLPVDAIHDAADHSIVKNARLASVKAAVFPGRKNLKIVGLVV